MTLQGETRAFCVRRVWYDEGNAENKAGLNLDLSYVDYDGEKLGIMRMHTLIWEYAGNQHLSDLTAIPLDVLDNSAVARKKLMERGRKFEALVGQHYLQYDRMAYKEAKCDGYTRFSVTGRVMVDCKTTLC